MSQNKKPELLILGIDGACPSYIRERIALGELPAFAELMRRGVDFEDCMPAFPSITPTCWSAISTGAVPAVNGALCQSVHVEGRDPFDFVTPYHSSHVHAERFWEAAARIGKTALLLDVPCSGPAKCDGILQISGGVDDTPDCEAGYGHSYGVPQQFFSNDGAEDRLVDTVKILGGTWKELYGACRYEKLSENAYRFYPVYTSERQHPEAVEPHTWVILCEEEGVRIGTDEANAAKAPLLRQGEWSQVITRRLGTDRGETVPFHFRARCDYFDAQSKTFTVFVTAAKNFYREITPLSLAREIAEIPGTTITDYSALRLAPANLNKFFEGEEQAVAWNHRVLTHCTERYAPDIVFNYYGHIDTLNHQFRNAYEGLKLHYPTQQSLAQEALRRGYELVDRHIAWMLAHLADENTTVVLISDHGSVGRIEDVNPWFCLEKAGLICYEEGGDWQNRRVDWSRTKAYPVSSCYVNVNLQGREPKGSVPPEQYDEVVQQILQALWQYAHSTDGRQSALAFAVPGDQAGFVGHGGKNCGDVVWGLMGSRVGGYIGGVHSHQIPSARSKTGDIRSLWTVAGPKFKEGISLSRPTDLTDVAPTLCYALGYPQPKDATGGVVFQALKE